MKLELDTGIISKINFSYLKGTSNNTVNSKMNAS